MKYTSDAALAEILRRMDTLRRARARRSLTALASTSAALFLVLLGTASTLGGAARASPEPCVYGAFLLPAQAGGYVLAAVLAFALGVAVTLLCVRFRNARNDTRPTTTTKQENRKK